MWRYWWWNLWLFLLRVEGLLLASCYKCLYCIQHPMRNHFWFLLLSVFFSRYADHYKSDNGTSFRTLYKTYGIRFVIVVQGTAGRFGAWPLFLNIGSGIALLSIVSSHILSKLTGILKRPELFLLGLFTGRPSVTDNMDYANTFLSLLSHMQTHVQTCSSVLQYIHSFRIMFVSVSY